MHLEAQVGEADLVLRLDIRRHDRVERRRGIDGVIIRHAGKGDALGGESEIAERAAPHHRRGFGTAHHDDDVAGRVDGSEQRDRA
ncbi:MAG: hypothetical protein ACREEN_00475, partial [Stellaceae bacterium]